MGSERMTDVRKIYFYFFLRGGWGKFRVTDFIYKGSNMKLKNALITFLALINSSIFAQDLSEDMKTWYIGSVNLRLSKVLPSRMVYLSSFFSMKNNAIHNIFNSILIKPWRISSFKVYLSIG